MNETNSLLHVSIPPFCEITANASGRNRPRDEMYMQLHLSPRIVLCTVRVLE